MGVRIEKNMIPSLQRRLPEMLDEAVRKTAFDIEAYAKQNAPVDTGALHASIYTMTDKQNGYAEAAEAVMAANGKAQVFPPATLQGPHEAIVAVAAEYGAYVEMGTVRQAPRPFLTPAVERARPRFAEAVAQAVKRAMNG